MSAVAIVGNGNLGFHFARRISEKHEVLVFSRNPNADGVRPLDKLVPSDFEFCLLCVPDDAIKEVSENLDLSGCIVVHTSGARPLADVSKHMNHGVIYPLQTFTREKEVDFNSFPIFIEATEDSEKSVFDFVRSFGTDVRLLSTTNRAKLHLAAVFACNFSNHMYHIADRILSSTGLPFSDLQHLAIETVDKAAELTPKKAQTGPAIRNDTETLANHLRLLEEADWQTLYELISADIRKTSR